LFKGITVNAPTADPGVGNHQFKFQLSFPGQEEPTAPATKPRFAARPYQEIHVYSHFAMVLNNLRFETSRIITSSIPPWKVPGKSMLIFIPMSIHTDLGWIFKNPESRS
jgi:hypothetical protein